MFRLHNKQMFQDKGSGNPYKTTAYVSFFSTLTHSCSAARCPPPASPPAPCPLLLTRYPCHCCLRLPHILKTNIFNVGCSRFSFLPSSDPLSLSVLLVCSLSFQFSLLSHTLHNVLHLSFPFYPSSTLQIAHSSLRSLSDFLISPCKKVIEITRTDYPHVIDRSAT